MRKRVKAQKFHLFTLFIYIVYLHCLFTLFIYIVYLHSSCQSFIKHIITELRSISVIKSLILYEEGASRRNKKIQDSVL